MNEPKLRFETDNGEKFPNLEVKRLGDITVPYNVRNKNTLPLEIYSVNNIVGFVPQSEQFDDAGYLRDTDTSIYMIVPPKHFAYNPARIDIGSIGYQYLDHDVQVSSLYEVFKASDSVDDDFLWTWFHTSYFNHTVKRLQEGGVRLYFYYDKMQETKIGLPSLPEQQKIASLFIELDKLIQSAESELEGYRELKHGMLQKMFPKKGEKVPEIRFPEFTGDWEQRKLEQVAKYRNGKAHENEIDESGDYIVVNSKFVSTNGEVKKYSASQIEPLFENEIAFVLSDVPNGRAIARTFLVNESGKYTLNQRIAGITPLDKTYPYFLHIVMNRNPYFLKFDDGVKQTNLSLNDVLNFKEYYPEYDEQKKIGEYFQNLDNLIASQEQELDGYKELKKGLLQQMFC